MKKQPLKDMHCVHLDFHTYDEIPDIGKDFDKDEFISAIKTAGLDSITVFAKCHHGNFYYPSEKFRTHPHLTKPLLDLQVEACREAGVSSKIYISVGYDEVSALQHPEWLVVSEDGAQQNLLSSYFHHLCVNTPYSELLVEQTKEVMNRYMPDGLFFDIVVEKVCTCPFCRESMKKKGLDFTNHEDLTIHAKDVFNNFTQTIVKTVKSIKPDTYVFFNAGDIPVNRRDYESINDQLEAESLPTGQWGYDHFPLTMSYIRKFGKNCIGMTGKFHYAWGEFGGFKYKDALMYEAAQCLAFDAGISVGDQLHPSARIDSYTYENIGNAVSFIKQREAWRGGEFLPELAILSNQALPFSAPLSRSGLGRILFEEKYLFDMIETAEISNKYPLIILANSNTQLSEEEYISLKNYVANGGKILACNKAPMYQGKIAFDLGAEYLSDDAMGLSYFEAKYPLRAADKMSLVIYEDAVNINATGEALAEKIIPYFKREGVRFCSHNNTPCDYGNRQPGITEGKDGIYIAADLFTDYAKCGSLNSKQLVLPLIARLLNQSKTIVTNLPSSGKAVLYKKDASYILHLLYANTVKRGRNTEVIEDIATVADIDVSLALPENINNAVLRPEGKALDIKKENGRLRFSLDKLHCYQIVELF